MYVPKMLTSMNSACLKADVVLHQLHNLVDSIGLGRRRFISGDTSCPDWILEEVLSVAGDLSDKDWFELLERLRRVNGELSKCEALIARAKSFPRNTTKEPL